MTKELENAKKKEESTTKKILNLKKELENAKKIESNATANSNTIHHMKK